MICKFCNAEIPEGTELCPVCGMTLTELPAEEAPVEEAPVEEKPEEEKTEEEISAEEAPVEEETVEESLSEETPVSFSETVTDQPETPAPAPRKVWPWVLGAVAAVLGLCILAVLLLIAMGMEIKLPKNDIFRKETYTVVDSDAVSNADDVVATMGSARLTNAQLQIYYRMQVLDFLNYYSSYLSSIGMDLAKPLSEQSCYFDETMSWEQYFISAALKTWESYQSMVLEAESVGFEMPEEMAQELATIPQSLEEQAAEGEYGSADAMLKELLGPACTVEAYMEYIRVNALSNEYYATEYEKLLPTDEDVEAYFTENEEAFTQNGITKDDGLVSSVRHILVCPKAEDTTEETTSAAEETTAPTEAAEGGFTEAQWAACLAQAEQILAEWKTGEATEESFAALVPVYTEDTGSSSTGGLYENINPTSSYVENFLNWSVDMARQPGDTDIVQTEYGYHIMYFVSGSPYWKSAAETQLLSERTTEMIEGIKEKFPMKVTYKKIALADLELA